VCSSDLPGPATGPVLLWLVIQLAALLLGALRIPLAAKYPQPAERLATHVMLATQVAASALLFPWLMRDWRTAAAVVATAWPFAAAASALSAVSLESTAAGEGYVTLWLAGLALWSRLLRGPRSQSFGVALAASVSIGAAVTWYLALEFGQSVGPGEPVGGSGGAVLAAFPMVAALRQLAPRGRDWRDPLLLLALIAVAVVALLTRHLRGRAKLSTTRTREAADGVPIGP